MGLRRNRYVRSLAARLPLTGPYERRVAELAALNAEQSAALDRARAEYAALDERTRTWVPLGHFYSPVPDLDAVRAHERRIWGADPADLPGIDLHLDDQRTLLDALEPLTRDVTFAVTAEDAAVRSARYWSCNPAFGEGDALWLVAMLRHFKPRRVVELGSGYSTACLLDATDADLGDGVEITCVDPHPQLAEGLVGPEPRARILQAGTEDVEIGIFSTLAAGDVLFIDSTHVARTGSDVNRIFFEILPALADGVVVHIHDVFPGFEYPPEWVYEGRAWTEQYMLRSFLQYNRRFSILLWPLLLYVLDPVGVGDRFPAMPRAQGASLWLRAGPPS